MRKARKQRLEAPDVSFYGKFPIYNPRDVVVGILIYMRIEDKYLSMIQDHRAANVDVCAFLDEFEIVKSVNGLQEKLNAGEKLRTDYRLLD